MSSKLGSHEKTESLLSFYFKDIAKYPPLSENEEIEVSEQIKKGNKSALRKLVMANLRFVVAVARNYQHQGVALSDLIEEGNCGLIQAARRFDGSRNFKFISYAVWWIRQAMVQAIANQSRVMRQPVGHAFEIRKANRAQQALEQKLGREPDLEELAVELGEKKDRILEALHSRINCTSLDCPLESDEQTTLHDIVSGEGPLPDFELVQEGAREILDKTLQSLDRREAEIVRLYFGIDGVPAYTLTQIGKKCKLTGERVRQVKQRALRKLRQQCRSRDLRSLMSSE